MALAKAAEERAADVKADEHENIEKEKAEDRLDAELRVLEQKATAGKRNAEGTLKADAEVRQRGTRLMM